MIEHIIINNYKSIKDLHLPLNRLNVLIGSNGVGKSNFISFFELTKAIYEQRFGSYTLSKGGIDNLLYQGRKHSDSIIGMIDFNNTNIFYFKLKPKLSDKGYIEQTGDFFNNIDDREKRYKDWHSTIWDNAVDESELINSKKWRALHLSKYLESFTVYHFHDTSINSLMRTDCLIDDNHKLRSNGSNLAAYLYRLQNSDEKSFRMIEAVIRSIAPSKRLLAIKSDYDKVTEGNLVALEIGIDTILEKCPRFRSWVQALTDKCLE